MDYTVFKPEYRSINQSINQSPHPAAHPAASSTPTSLSSTNPPNNPLHLSTNTHARRCLHTGGGCVVSFPMRLIPPNTHLLSALLLLLSFLLFTSWFVIELLWCNEVWTATSAASSSFPTCLVVTVVAGKAEKANAGQEQFQARRRTWWYVVVS